MVRIRVTYEPSGHRFRFRFPLRQDPPAPTLQAGLAQGVRRVNSLSGNLLRCRPTPPCANFLIERASGAPPLGRQRTLKRTGRSMAALDKGAGRWRMGP